MQTRAATRTCADVAHAWQPSKAAERPRQRRDRAMRSRSPPRARTPTRTLVDLARPPPSPTVRGPTYTPATCAATAIQGALRAALSKIIFEANGRIERGTGGADRSAFAGEKGIFTNPSAHRSRLPPLLPGNGPPTEDAAACNSAAAAVAAALRAAEAAASASACDSKGSRSALDRWHACQTAASMFSLTMHASYASLRALSRCGGMGVPPALRAAKTPFRR